MTIRQFLMGDCGDKDLRRRKAVPRHGTTTCAAGPVAVYLSSEAPTAGGVNTDDVNSKPVSSTVA
jgi:hypothetical protein